MKPGYYWVQRKSIYQPTQWGDVEPEYFDQEVIDKYLEGDYSRETVRVIDKVYTPSEVEELKRKIKIESSCVKGY